MPLSKVRLPDRHPYEYYLLIACAAFGALDLLDLVPTPASIRAQLPVPWLWSWLLLAGSSLGLLAIIWPRRHRLPMAAPAWRRHVTLLLLEQVGLVMAGVSAGFYAVVLAKTQQSAAAFAILMNGGFAVASIAQARIIQKFIRQIRAALRLAAQINAEKAQRAELAEPDERDGGLR